MKCIFVPCLVVTLALVCSQSWSATYDVSGECPGDFEMPRDSRTEVFTTIGQPELYIGAFDDTRIQDSVSDLIAMHTKLRVLSIEGDRIEIASRKKLHNGSRICGWISEDDVLDNEAEPVKVGTPVTWTDPVTNVSKTLDNPLELKALLRSNPEYERGGSNATEVKIYDYPDTKSPPRTTASVFGIYKVYDTRETSEGLWYWIAGEDPGYPTRFSGWVPEYHVMLWESQLSMYFNESSDNAKIYATLSQASTADSDGVLGRRPQDFKERSLGASTGEGNEINIARFPILNEVESPLNDGQTIYRIGFFGDDQNLAVGGIGDEESRRAKIQQSIKNVDILFLLDNTLSMTEYFHSVVKAVQNASEEINVFNEENGYDTKVKFAAAIYGDYQDERADIDQMQFKIVSRLGRPGNTRHLDKLTAIAETPNSHFIDALADRPEAGLAAIIRGIEDLQWTSESLVKVIVWIGDHGSREPGDKENTSILDVQNALSDANVFVLPINVSGRYDAEWNFKFIDQGDRITAGDRGLETRMAHDGGQSNDYDRAREIIEQSIATMYQSSLVANLALREQTDIVETMEDRREIFELNIPVAESDVLKISQSICQMAFGEQGCQSIQKSGQFMAEGYVPFDNKLKAFNFWVNLTEDQLRLLQGVLENTCKGFERGNVKKYIEAAMTQVQNAMGGDRYRSDIPVGEYLRQFFLLPSGHFPSFLESTPANIEEAWQVARDIDSDNGDIVQTKAIADPICRSATLLNLVVNDKRVEQPEQDVISTADITGNETYKWSVEDESELIQFDWEWAQGGENNYLYIPVEFLPGSIPVN